MWCCPCSPPTSLQPSSDPAVTSGEGQALELGTLTHLAVDDYGSLAWSLHEKGFVQLRELDNGALLEQLQLMPGKEVTRLKVSGHQGRVVAGFADGSIMTMRLSFTVEFLADDDLPDRYATMQVGERRVYENTLIERTPEGQLRQSRLELVEDQPVQLGASPIRLIDVSERSGRVGGGGPGRGGRLSRPQPDLAQEPAHRRGPHPQRGFGSVP